MKLIKLPILMLVLTVFFACVNEPDEETPPDDSIFRPKAVTMVNFSGETSTVTLDDLQGHSIYLVKANKGDKTVPAANTGKVLNIGIPQDVLAKNALNAAGVIQQQALFMAGGGGDKPISGIFTGPNGETIIRYEHHPNNEKIFDAINAENLNVRSVSRSMGAEYAVAAPTSGRTIDDSTKEFWTQDDSGNFTQINTTLRAAGTYSNVWVADANYDNSSTQDNTITTAQAQALADKFDTIYQKETPVFGFEYGGGLFNGTVYSGNGGVDGDPKIQILVYDIFGDYKSNQNGGVFGYFWAGDEFETGNPVLGGGKSNEAEIFYIDAHFTDLAPDAIYSTLAHEFQHMINFNVKYPEYTATWYNEMLSMLAEDLIDPFIGINVDNNDHPIKSRIPTFLSNYFRDPTVWLDGNGVYASYANAYALGAYLVRNFGGVNFVKAVMSNSVVDDTSLTLALADSSVNPLSDEVKNFDAAISRYDEVLLFNQNSENRPKNILSFNNTVSSDGYTFTGFDLFSLENGYTIGGKKATGPLVWNAAGDYDMEPHTVRLLSSNEWQNVTGSRSITLQRPANPYIELHIIVR